jgi:hypothetical protein
VDPLGFAPEDSLGGIGYYLSLCEQNGIDPNAGLSIVLGDDGNAVESVDPFGFISWNNNTPNPYDYYHFGCSRGSAQYIPVEPEPAKPMQANTLPYYLIMYGTGEAIGGAALGTTISAAAAIALPLLALAYGYYMMNKDLYAASLDLTPEKIEFLKECYSSSGTYDLEDGLLFFSEEHTNGKRPSTTEQHEKGLERKI